MALYTTIQQVFDKIWDHFVVNKGEQSLDGCGSCQYRGPKGARCAIGVCIPDDLYDEEMEGKIVTHIHSNFSSVYEAVFNGLDPIDLKELQQAHDRWSPGVEPSFAQHIEAQLRYYAARHNLTIPEGVTTDD